MDTCGSKPPKIIQIITLSEIGGAQKVVYQIVSELKDKFDFIVICHPGGELVDWLQDLGIRVITLESLRREINPIHDFRALFQLVKIIKQEKPDIVHCHSSKAGILGRLAARIAAVRRIVFTVHSWGFNDFQTSLTQRIYVMAEKLIAGFTDSIICVSNNDYRIGISKKIAPPEKFQVIHNGVDPASIVGIQSNLRAELRLDSQSILVGCIGRLAEPKEPLTFIDIAKSIVDRPEFKDAKFVWIGDGPLMEQSLVRIEQYGLSGNVFFIGKRENAALLCSDFDIFMLLSKWEGLPLVLIEAMFQGKPLLCYDVGGISELVLDNINGCIVPYGEVQELIHHLSVLISDPEYRKQLAQKSKDLSDKFSLDNTINSYNLLYQRVNDRHFNGQAFNPCESEEN